ncbi:MAG: low-specificity L-threonine aldolase [Anaerolinea sp.]|nr:low-specificity L-threonine aldolase [Anaerolinea sp.]
MDWIDIRSDTVTVPTPEMRKAMAEAEVGDDVFGEDPTINRLQELAAGMLGKEVGLFVTSGTMGNLLAVLTHCARGDETILGSQCHTYMYEAGGIASLGGVTPFVVPNQPDGTLSLKDVQDAIRPLDDHFPRTRLVLMENTHNRCGGVPLGVQYTRSLADLAHNNGLGLHLDGARIFNAAAAYEINVADLTGPVDSVTFCLSKGLCAPVGSVLCGSSDFIREARRIRKQLGGGMRQAGVIAAAGIIALEKMSGRLAEDHIRAKRLADGLAAAGGMVLDPGSPHTNMVFANLEEHVQVGAMQIVEMFKQRGILAHETGLRRFRFVIHYWVDDLAVNKIIQAWQDIYQEIK